VTRYFTKSAHIATPSQDGYPCDWVSEPLPQVTVTETFEESFTGLYDLRGREIHCQRKGMLGIDTDKGEPPQ